MKALLANWRFFLAFGLPLALTCYAYLPGLDGNFLLDDIPNLEFLANIVGEGDLWSMLSQARGQYSGITRVLPNLTFIAQAKSWPDEPFNMLAVNLAIHLANGLLVFLLTHKLARLASAQGELLVASLVSLIWLMHPLQISGVLYVIQRINLLSTFFSLGGLLLYLHGRTNCLAGSMRATFWMVCGLFGGGALAFACKENGALLPLLALVIEFTLLSGLPVLSRRLKFALLYLPQIAIVAGVIALSGDLRRTYANAEFSLVQRLLTEAHVVLDYVYRILLPRSAGLGLYHDDFPLAAMPPGGLDLAWAALVVGTILAAVVWRKRQPVAALGVLWFAAGQVLESTVIPLELYFEHRNYLPAFGLLFSCVFLVRQAIGQFPVRAAWLLKGAGAVWMASSVATTVHLVALWGNPPLLVATWAKEHPQSPRALSHYANMSFALGNHAEGIKVMSRLAQDGLGRAEYYPDWIRMVCQDKAAMAPNLNRVRQAFAALAYKKTTINGLGALADYAEEKPCTGYAAEELASLVGALLANPAYQTHRHRLLLVRGRLYGSFGQWEKARADFHEAYVLHGAPPIGFLEVRACLAMNRLDEARRAFAELSAQVENGGAEMAKYRPTLLEWKRRLPL